jgi:spore coat polysaccharide biosynthesis protein SpsF
MILAVLQARMSSTRLPGKVMKPLLGRPMMARQIERILRTSTIDQLVVATSDDPSDDIVATFCRAEGIAYHRGSLHDVLDRYHSAAESFGPADHVVRLTADCPLTDPGVIAEAIALHVASGADYTSNSINRTYPVGLDVEVMTLATLSTSWRDAAISQEREHVTMYIYRNPERFRIVELTQSLDLGLMRWTVDTIDDFQMVEKVYGALYPRNPAFTWPDVLAFLQANPDIAAINGALGPGQRHCPPP